MSDPAMKAKIDKANALRVIKKEGVDTTKVGEAMTEEILASSPTIKQAMEGGLTPDEFAKLTKFKDQEKVEASLLVKKNKYDNMKVQYDNIENDIKTKMSGS